MRALANTIEPIFEFEPIYLKRGGKSYLVEEFVYTENRTRNGKTYLTCQEAKKNKCSAG